MLKWFRLIVCLFYTIKPLLSVTFFLNSFHNWPECIISWFVQTGFLVSIFRAFAHVRLLFFSTPFADANWAEATVQLDPIRFQNPLALPLQISPKVKKSHMARQPFLLCQQLQMQGLMPTWPAERSVPISQSDHSHPSPSPLYLQSPSTGQHLSGDFTDRDTQAQAGGVNCQSLGVGEGWVLGLNPDLVAWKCCSQINFSVMLLPSQSTNLLISFPATEKIHPTCDKHQAREKTAEGHLQKLSHGCERSSSWETVPISACDYS